MRVGQHTYYPLTYHRRKKKHMRIQEPRDGIYNVATGLPRSIRLSRVFAEGGEIAYTRHATKQALLDRYGHIPTPDTLRWTFDDVVEVTVAGGAATKVVVRLPFRNSRDAVYVIKTDRHNTAAGVCLTCWSNLSIDRHAPHARLTRARSS
jgi:hypothetical protein